MILRLFMGKATIGLLIFPIGRSDTRAPAVEAVRGCVEMESICGRAAELFAAAIKGPLGWPQHAS